MTELQVQRLLEVQTELSLKVSDLTSKIATAREAGRPTLRLEAALTAAERRLAKCEQNLDHLTAPEPPAEVREQQASESEDAGGPSTDTRESEGRDSDGGLPSLPESYKSDGPWPRPCPRGTHVLTGKHDVYVVPSSQNHQCVHCRREIRREYRRNRARANGSAPRPPMPATVKLNGRADAVRSYSQSR